jgi:hypothetical protein
VKVFKESVGCCAQTAIEEAAKKTIRKNAPNQLQELILEEPPQRTGLIPGS